MTVFDLAANPFFLLNTDPRADREQLSATFDEVLSRPGGDETSLIAAFHQLTLPLPRLQAELAWLGGSVRAETAAMLVSGIAPDVAFVDLSSLAAANLAAHLCAHGEHTAERREALLDCLCAMHAELNLPAITDSINADRCVSGFPPIDERLVEPALERLRLTHRDSALEALLVLPQPAGVLTRLLRRHRGCKGAALLLGALSEAFDRASLPELLGRESQTEATLQRLLKPAVLAERDLGALGADLCAWAELALPRQLVMAAQLRDEPRSLALGAALRDAIRRVEKQPGGVVAALALVRLARQAFGALPGLSEILADDEARLAVAAASVAPRSVAPAAAVDRQPVAAEPRGQSAARPPAAATRELPSRVPPCFKRLARGRLGPHPLWRLGLYGGAAVAGFVIVVVAAGAHPRPPQRLGQDLAIDKLFLSDRS